MNFILNLDINSKHMIGVLKKYESIQKVFLKNGYDIKSYYFNEYTRIERKYYETQPRDKKIRNYRNRINKLNKLYSCRDIEIESNCVYYIRYYRANKSFVNLLKNIKANNNIILLEFPTYPYDGEMTTFIEKIKLFIDKKYRKELARYVDYAITFSKDQNIFGINAINISNGVDLEVNVVSEKLETKEINLIGVANLSKWHGYDRVIEGLKEYYIEKDDVKRKIRFHIVGKGKEYENLYSLVRKYKLENVVQMHGFKSGKELQQIYDQCNLGVGCLGIHRKGMNQLSDLKSKEYCARGIGIIKSFEDIDFKNFKYSLDVSADDKAIEIDEVIKFFDNNILNNKQYSFEVRKYAEETLSWDSKLEAVLEKIVT